MSLRRRFAIIVIASSFVLPSLVFAQMDHSSHGSPAGKPATTASAAQEEGTVKKVDKAAGKLSIAHEAQKNGMPAMTMVYKVKDAATLDKIQQGQKIRFVTDTADAMTIVRIEATK